MFLLKKTLLCKELGFDVIIPKGTAKNKKEKKKQTNILGAT